MSNYYNSDQSGWFDSGGGGAAGGGGGGQAGWDNSGGAGGGGQSGWDMGGQSGWDNQDFGYGGGGNDNYGYGGGQQQHQNYGFIPSVPQQQQQQQQAKEQKPSMIGGNMRMGGGNENINRNMPPSQRPTSDVDFEDEPPLLEELGINFSHIRQKTFAVLNPLAKGDTEAINDQDLAGPLAFCLLFGFSLLLHGKLQFGYIYGIGLLGCAGMYMLLNMMAPNNISVTCTVSVLGYCLLPMSLLSLLAAVASFKGTIGLAMSIMAVLWCSSSAAKLFVTALDMDHQQLLVAYPCGLIYGVFALLAIF